jgi:hypothetical protein
VVEACHSSAGRAAAERRAGGAGGRRPPMAVPGARMGSDRPFSKLMRWLSGHLRTAGGWRGGVLPGHAAHGAAGLAWG